MPDYPGLEVTYNTLRLHDENNRPEVYLAYGDELVTVSVRKLLDGVEPQFDKKQLREALVGASSGNIDTLRMLGTDAGIPMAQVALQGPVDTICFNLVEAADKHRKLPALRDALKSMA